MFTYIVDENNTVWGYVSTQVEACLMQPQKPNGEPWADAAEATAWAEAWLLHMSDPENNEFLP
jgi:hypothetical protein